MIRRLTLWKVKLWVAVLNVGRWWSWNANPSLQNHRLAFFLPHPWIPPHTTTIWLTSGLSWLTDKQGGGTVSPCFLLVLRNLFGYFLMTNTYTNALATVQQYSNFSIIIFLVSFPWKFHELSRLCKWHSESFQPGKLVLFIESETVSWLLSFLEGFFLSRYK